MRHLAVTCAVTLAAMPLVAQDAPEPAAPQTDAAPRTSDARLPAPRTDWTGFHGQLSAQKYSPLDQINRDNVSELELAFRIETGDVSDETGDKPASVWSATPIYANETLYLGTPFYRVLALDPATGEERWSFDSQSSLEALTQPALKNRGVSYWEADQPSEGEACQRIVYLGTMDAQLFALDADTGEPCTGFAEGGVLDVNQWNDTNDRWPLSLLQPPTVVGDHVIIGWAGKDWEWAEAPPGTVFSVDARTGELEWTVELLPEDIRQQTGTANVWTAMSADEERGLVYLPVSSPSPNYWGGNRLDDVPYATSTTAVDVETGEVVWSYQYVRHDVWDYDTNAAPTLMDITVDGEEIPALLQSTKMGLLWALNRETGEPIWEVTERDVPTDTEIEGEVLRPTQPIPSKPDPVVDLDERPEVWWLADLVSFGECSRIFENARYEGIYTPLTTEGTGTIVYPATFGGQQWGGIGFDPENQVAIVNSSRAVQILDMYPREEYEAQAGGSGNEQGFYPQTGAPYGFELYVPLNWAGMPCWEPPYGDIRAIDMTTGETLWSRPIGASQRYGFYMPESMGSPTIGGPAVTAGGLIFIGATMDQKVRAYDIETGEELWEDVTEAPVVANPAVYEHDGVEYVAFVSGGNSILKPTVGDMVSVYRLPPG
ncbi:pyrroloquinoline quinone-dependent dehydrogenase [Maritimibacter dapengensis]|uniref:Pyrroloquinoline quinone-dependent dehydrogenase n=1 Tax=Maritimibacter dapengensis TaxID=2836868 RepID=A0ABS6T7C6_9RHOB|nr:pyrroloquinoline quinone-dependent dehydrogenase [Maritimibacter dapengensis]MBV7380396.1 pyrroloquinoline quinone-dependent dehydrogenase [Maritimibacter dapengensis]